MLKMILRIVFNIYKTLDKSRSDLIDNGITIKNVALADDELWDLKVSLYDNYWTIVDAWHTKGNKGKCTDPDAEVVDDLAHKLCHESIKEITDEVDATGISEYD